MEEKNTWERIVEELSKDSIIEGCKTREEICAEVETSLCNRYNTTPNNKIKEMAEAMTEDLIRILNIEGKEENG